MLFGIHNHYEGNAISGFQSPHNSVLFDEALIRITDQGLVIFNLGKQLSLDEKLRLASSLDRILKRELNTRLSFTTCGMSDDLDEQETANYFRLIKKINPAIVTLYATYMSRMSKERLMCPTDPAIDHILDQGSDLMKQMLAVLKPSTVAKATPPEGWDAFEVKLRKIFEKARADATLPRDMSVLLKNRAPKLG